ncbi:MAG: hypothetical protein JXB50_08830 [Spirochaetes bacterium]|nr:hypothetical protein [Spirochaetota bacterium]
MNFLKKKLKFIILFIIIFFLSCPSEMVKYTIWKGKYKVSSSKEFDIELIFDSSSTVTCLFEIDNNIINNLYSKSDFILTENYTFKVEFKKKCNLDLDIFDDDYVELKLEGTLDYFKNIGKGDIALTIFVLSTGVTTKGTWEVRKLTD